MAWTSALFLALGATLALPAGAVTYCCTDDNGRRVCGDIVPVQCQKRAYQEFNAQGVLTRQHEGPMTAEQRARRDAETAHRKVEEEKAAEAQRRDRALMVSYTSAADIDAKRDRMIEEVQASLELAQERLGTALARQTTLQREAEFYRKKPMPDTLKASLRENDIELAAQQATVEDRRKDIEAIRARFDDEKKRYLSLGGRPAPNSVKTKPPAKN